MASKDTLRRLAAILCADVVGYSRLMGEKKAARLKFNPPPFRFSVHLYANLKTE